ncbi:hypothetical protein B0A49_08406 [Cryomyces minteri]|uniref:Thymidylate kinase n=1 Tax=Cryomyces minteri TaxID=331657 RepID=A0A4V5NDM2_9PEZI|nr:hypothetical protein B0A49_08406 [Cryomyces minteri]
MATQAPVSAIRQPFGALDGARLQSLTNTKNRQNALPDFSQALGKGMVSSPLRSTVYPSPTKRRRAPSFDILDTENIDPSIFGSSNKRSKNHDGTSSKASAFVLTGSIMPSAKSTPFNFSSPTTAATTRLAETPRSRNIVPPLKTPVTAPAGRSPIRKRAAMLSRRRISAPFTRIDPPSSVHSSLPFSLDAALNSTLSKPEATQTTGDVPKPEIALPKSWFFEIHVDTEAEVAENLMEHSTLTLDLGSDEESSRAAKEDRGKENMPPPDWTGNTSTITSTGTAHTSVVTNTDAVKPQIVRRPAPDAMTDGARSPLSDLDASDFIPEGLSADSHVVVPPTPKKPSLDVRTAGLLHSRSAPELSSPSPLNGEAIRMSSAMATAAAAAAGGHGKGKARKAEEAVEIWVDDDAALDVDAAAAANESVGKRKRDDGITA